MLAPSLLEKVCQFARSRPERSACPSRYTHGPGSCVDGSGFAPASADRERPADRGHLAGHRRTADHEFAQNRKQSAGAGDHRFLLHQPCAFPSNVVAALILFGLIGLLAAPHAPGQQSPDGGKFAIVVDVDLVLFRKVEITATRIGSPGLRVIARDGYFAPGDRSIAR